MFFAVVDGPPKCLQGGRKSLVYVRKCRHSRRSNLQDRSISALRMSKRLQRDTLLLLRSNRKPGARIWLHMFPPYFCFRFSRYGPRHSVNYRPRDHVWLTIYRSLIEIFTICLQRSIVHRNVYKLTLNPLSISEKCFHHRRSNLRDRSTYDTYRAMDHVWLTISRPLIALFRIFLQPSIDRQNVYKVTENRWSM